MYVETVPNRNSPPAILLREGWREGKRVRKRTLANLSDWPLAKIETLRRLLKNQPLVSPEDAFDIVRSKPHGHVAAVLGSVRKLGLELLLSAAPCPERERVLALICARVLAPVSKLATARGLAEATARDTLAESLELGEVDEDDLYGAMDWLLERQGEIEGALARRHLGDGAVVLYDLTSVYLEGRRCPLARHGHSRDGKRGKLQIEFGLLCDRDGRPVAVEVFEGDTADPMTVGAQVDKLRRRFGLSKVVLVGDRGMLTEARIRQEVEPAGLDWISALRSAAIRRLVESGAVQMSLFDQTDLVEVHSEDYPGERLMVCRNPLLKAERARKREELLQATERLLDPIVAATRRLKRPLAGRERIALRVGRVLDKYKMAKHFHLDITDHSFGYTRNPDSIAREAALDGLYVVRTSLPENQLDAHRTVHAYKSLSRVERAFRSFKTVDLKVRAGLPPGPGTGARPCPVVHARLLRRMAHAPAPRALAVRRPRPRQRTALLRGGASQDLARSSEQGSHQTHRGRLARPQLPLVARRLGHHRQKPRRPATPRRPALRPAHSPNSSATSSLRTPRRSTRTFPVAEP